MIDLGAERMLGIERNGERIAEEIKSFLSIYGTIRIHQDNTEEGIADEMEAAGIPKSDIVRAFHPERDRGLIPDYTVA